MPSTLLFSFAFLTAHYLGRSSAIRKQTRAVFLSLEPQIIRVTKHLNFLGTEGFPRCGFFGIVPGKLGQVGHPIIILEVELDW